jgi:hypothetical protein
MRCVPLVAALVGGALIAALIISAVAVANRALAMHPMPMILIGGAMKLGGYDAAYPCKETP